jgi:hypothetical protein
VNRASRAQVVSDNFPTTCIFLTVRNRNWRSELGNSETDTNRQYSPYYLGIDMAISAVHYQLLKEHAHLLVRGGSLLEIGEANWYGDLDPKAVGINPRGTLFDIAKDAYQLLFAPSIVEAVDVNGTRAALKQDLNGQLNLPRQYDTIINHGTAEHVFNIGMVFKSMHDWAKCGGIMIHESPFNGWIDHGFYTLQPTLFYDLAAANEYELISLAVCEIYSRTIIRVESREHFHAIAGDVPQNAILFVVLRKTTSAPFRLPFQGYYDGRLSERGKEVWQENR